MSMSLAEIALAETTAKAEYEAKLLLEKACALCGERLGDLNGPEGEEPLRKHFEHNHPKEPLRTVIA